MGTEDASTLREEGAMIAAGTEDEDVDVGVDEEDDDDDPLPVPLVDATGTVGTCDLNDNRATRPEIVPVTARITRRMSRIISL